MEPTPQSPPRRCRRTRGRWSWTRQTRSRSRPRSGRTGAAAAAARRSGSRRHDPTGRKWPWSGMQTGADGRRWRGRTSLRYTFLLLRYTFLLLQPGYLLLQPCCFLLLQAANFGQKLPNCIHSQYTGPLMSAKGLLSVQLDRSTNVPQQTSQRAVYNSLDDPQTPLLDRSARTSLWTILFCGCY